MPSTWSACTRSTDWRFESRNEEAEATLASAIGAPGELLAIRLESRGYRVSVEATARGGLARLGREQVDVMILDQGEGFDDGGIHGRL